MQQKSSAGAPPPSQVEERPSPTIELVPPQESGALATRSTEGPILGPLAYQGDAVAVIQRMGETLLALQRALIAMTQPEDWIVQGTGLALLGNNGCNRAAPLLGLTIDPLPGCTLDPIRRDLEGGGVEYAVSAWAYSKTLGRGEEIEAIRSSRERNFLGRQVDGDGSIVRKDGVGPFDPDHRNATRSLLLSKAVRKLGGLGNVPETMLLEVFGPAAKSRFQRGHGAGSGTDRGAQSVAEPGVAEKAKELGDEILRRAGGDVEVARATLRDITINKEGKYARDSVAQFTKIDQVEWAWKRLKTHKTFGDGKQQQTQQREPGDDE